MEISGKTLWKAIRYQAQLARKQDTIARRVRLAQQAGDRLELSVCGSSFTLRTLAPFEGDGLDEPRFVETDLLYKLSQRLKKKTLTLQSTDDGLDHDELLVKYDDVETRLAAGEGIDLDKLAPCEHYMTMPAAAFAEVFSQAIEYASNDWSRPGVCGVMVDIHDDCRQVTATDGHRLFNRKLVQPVDGDELKWGECEMPADGVFFATDALEFALKLIDSSGPDIQVDFDASQLRISQPDHWVIEMIRPTGRFPDWRRLIPPPDIAHSVVFESDALTDALKTSKLFLDDSETVVLDYNGAVELRTSSHDGKFRCDFGENTMTKTAQLGFNPDYLLAAVETLDVDHIRQFVGDGMSPQMFVADHDTRCDTLVIVMPKRL